MESTSFYVLPEVFDLKNLTSEISKFFTIRSHAPCHIVQSYYDTFDWRLFNKSRVLFREGNEFQLRSMDTNKMIASVSVTMKKRYLFWWDFPDSLLKEKLHACLTVRALIPFCKIDKQSLSWVVLNKDDKTILRVYIEMMDLTKNRKKKNLLHVMRLQSLRGYERDLVKFEKFIDNQGFEKRKPSFFYTTAFFALKRPPGSYTAKMDLKLDPAMPALPATLCIFRRLLHTIRANERGIILDIDSEFLHDFRVAVRRTRSALSQIKGIFPPEETHNFKKDIAYLGRQTNRLRDLDVYLHKKDQYRSMLPEPLREGVNFFFDYLSHQRMNEHREFADFLISSQYKKILSSWDLYLASQEKQPPNQLDATALPVLQVAKKMISKRHDQILESGRKINVSTSDEELHKLRIRCKQLRYLMEFFSSLFPEKDMKNLISQLRKLQDNLGDFNDLYVQQKNLKFFLEKMAPTNRDIVNVAAAIGGLVTQLRQEQIKVRGEFTQKFKEFNSKENIELFRHVFGS